VIVALNENTIGEGRELMSYVGKVYHADAPNSSDSSDASVSGYTLFTDISETSDMDKKVRMFNDFASNVTGETCVVKFNKLTTASCTRSKLECIAAAQIYAAMYNAVLSNCKNALRNLPHIQVVNPFVLTCSNTTKVCKFGWKPIPITPQHLAKKNTVTLFGEMVLPGTFRKFMNNFSHQCSNLDEAIIEDDTKILDMYRRSYCSLHAWILFCFADAVHVNYFGARKCVYMPTDLQGVLHMGTFQLTDIAASSQNVMSFDRSLNNGEKGIMLIARKAYKCMSKYAPSVFEQFLNAIGKKASVFASLKEEAVPKAPAFTKDDFKAFLDQGILTSTEYESRLASLTPEEDVPNAGGKRGKLVVGPSDRKLRQRK
jgi:hypothetical protein